MLICSPGSCVDCCKCMCMCVCVCVLLLFHCVHVVGECSYTCVCACRSIESKVDYSQMILEILGKACEHVSRPILPLYLSHSVTLSWSHSLSLILNSI